MGRGIIGTIQLGIAVALAVPVAMLGVQFLVEGRTPMGIAFLGIAALMVGVEEYLTTPGDVPGMVASRVAGRVVKEPDSDEE
jgi:hypothetical protein